MLRSLMPLSPCCRVDVYPLQVAQLASPHWPSWPAPTAEYPAPQPACAGCSHTVRYPALQPLLQGCPAHQPLAQDALLWQGAQLGQPLRQGALLTNPWCKGALICNPHCRAPCSPALTARCTPPNQSLVHGYPACPVASPYPCASSRPNRSPLALHSLGCRSWF